MRQPLRTTQRQQISTIKSYPAPVGGLNARDSITEMAPTDATDLDNFFPRTTWVEIRGGYADHATGMTGNCKSILVYNGMNGTNKMFGTTSSGIYDISSAGAVGASVLARTNGKHQWTMFGDGTSNWLIACNGVDKPAYYDGATWTAVDGASTPALTGVTSSTLVQPLIFKGRLMFIQVNTMYFWYLASGVAGGALTEFDLSGEFKHGGYLQSIGSWTRDAGDGQDDIFVAISSEGEIVCYQGNNPSSATTWAKIGTFYVGRPLGRRCMVQYGGDLLLILESGVYGLSDALQSAIIDHKEAISYKIENAFLNVARTSGSVFGWESIVYPAYGALIVNAPISEDGEHQQFVMNTINKSWCRFTDWDAETFGLFNNELYFAVGTKVVKAWTGAVDGTDAIIAYGKQAFQDFGSPGVQKEFQMFRPVLAVNGPLTFLTGVDIDYADNPINGTAFYSVQSGGQWDVSNWGEG